MKTPSSFITTRFVHGVVSALANGNANGSRAARGVNGVLLRCHQRLLSTAASDSSVKPPARRAVLALEDGSTFEGFSFGAHKGV